MKIEIRDRTNYWMQLAAGRELGKKWLEVEAEHHVVVDNKAYRVVKIYDDPTPSKDRRIILVVPIEESKCQTSV